MYIGSRIHEDLPLEDGLSDIIIGLYACVLLMGESTDSVGSKAFLALSIFEQKSCAFSGNSRLERRYV